MSEEVAGTSYGRFWKEWEFWLLLGLTMLFFFTRVTAISIRGEESRRGRIAWEMLDRGDWIVPRVQGEPVFFRPPLQNWLIAVVGRLRGEVDTWAVRLPSQLAILGTVILLYGYARCFASRWGAFCTGLVFATFGQVLELGRLGETEAVFTFFLAGGLVCWRWGLLERAPGWLTWSLGYGMAAAATLTKGPQAPVYFVGSIWIFLLVTRQWRELFRWGHLIGMGVALCVIAGWQVPYAQQLGWPTSFRVYFGDVGPRFNSMNFRSVSIHMLTFPAELLCGSLMPWSVCLIPFASRRFRQGLDQMRMESLFLAVCILVTFPSVWITPGASLRYYMPLFPCFAGLVGIALERGLFRFEAAEWRLWFRRYLAVLGVVVCGAGTVAMLLAIALPQSHWSPTIGVAAVYLVLCTICAGLIWYGMRAQRRVQLASLLAVIGVGSFLGLTQGTVLVDIRQKMSVDARAEIQQLRESLPADKPLVSLGPIHHLFLFHLARPVQRISAEMSAPVKLSDNEYFCVWVKGQQRPQFEFPWASIAEISCDRNKRPHPNEAVVIGKRLARTPLAGTD